MYCEKFRNEVFRNDFYYICTRNSKTQQLLKQHKIFNTMKKTLFITLFLAAICIMPSCKKDAAQTKVVFGEFETNIFRFVHREKVTVIIK